MPARCKQPTTIPPGPDRVDVYATRYGSGQELWHPSDYRGHTSPGMFLTPSDLERFELPDVDEEYDAELDNDWD